MKKAKTDIACGVVLDIIAVLLIIGSFSIKHISSLTFDVGSAYFPRICAALLLFLGTALIISSAVKVRKEKQQVLEAEKKEEEPEKIKNNTTALVKTLAVIAVLCLFALLLQKVGFIICSFVLVFVLILVLAPREEIKLKKVAVWILISAIASVGIYFLFVELFNLLLPIGLLG
jgi:putative tricarboxylic transport membrane protein